MIIRDIKKSHLYPAVLLEKVLSHHMRHVFLRTVDVSLALFIFVLSVGGLHKYYPNFGVGVVSTITHYSSLLVGLAFILLGVWLFTFLLEAFFRAYYFEKIAGIPGNLVPGNESHPEWNRITFEALLVLSDVKDDDPWRAFFSSELGKRVCMRAGIPLDDTKNFITKRGMRSFGQLSIPQGEILSIAKLAQLLIDNDPAFAQFLLEHNISKEEWAAASMWAADEYARDKERERWWTRERLARVPSIGRDFSYGEAYVLKRYAKDLTASVMGGTPNGATKQADALLDLERVLLRARGANALVVAPITTVGTELMYAFARMIAGGAVQPGLENKRLFMLAPEAMIAATENKLAFERLFLTMMNEVAQAGNVIVAFERINAFAEGVRPLGVNLFELLEPYLTSGHLQIIVTVDQNEFHDAFEPNSSLMSHFSVVKITETEGEETTRILENAAEALEIQHGVFFTYPAVHQIIHAAEEFYSDGIMPDKAIDLLIELVPYTTAAKTPIVTRKLVDGFVARKTNIPVGEITAAERDKLTQLEAFLHKRVIGQDEAVVAIANAMRRARAGVRNEKRPIGTFLFLGPTGVGKTETAKALAEVFFGSEDAMSRLDMTEYRTSDALARLIGSFEGGAAGTFSTILRDKSYGVILLDEFEKTNTEVLDLFLQVFDEGIFSDMRGHKVNARQSIFIATSNAGSDLIWDKMKSGVPLSSAKDEIVSEIVHRGIFKPELLNRFDGVILFTPLDDHARKQIARLLLEKFAQEVRQKGINFVVSDTLVDYIAARGNDPVFGARPMRRAMQETIERIVAEKVIAGTLPAGSRLELSLADLPQHS